MSDAIAPPTVTYRVPGVTGTNQPRGSSQRMSESRLVPAPTVTSPCSRSMVFTPVSAVASSTIPPPFSATSPYERPRPRAITPRGRRDVEQAADVVVVERGDDPGAARRRATPAREQAVVARESLERIQAT